VFYQKQLLKGNSHFTAFSVDFDKSIKNKEMKPDTFHLALTPINTQRAQWTCMVLMFASISKSAKGLCKLRMKSHVLKGLLQPWFRWLNMWWIESVSPVMGLYVVLHTQDLLSLHIAAEIYSILSLLVTSAQSIIQMVRHLFSHCMSAFSFL